MEQIEITRHMIGYSEKNAASTSVLFLPKIYNLIFIRTKQQTTQIEGEISK